MKDKNITAADLLAGARPAKAPRHKIQHYGVRLVKEKSRYYPVTQIGNFDDLVKVTRAELGHLPHEEVIAIGLSGKNEPIGIVKVSQGGISGTAMVAADVIRPLIAMGARAFVIAHNHPSGDPTPSQDDINMTRLLAKAAECVNLTLLDHVVVGGVRGGGATSLRDVMTW